MYNKYSYPKRERKFVEKELSGLLETTIHLEDELNNIIMENKENERQKMPFM